MGKYSTGLSAKGFRDIAKQIHTYRMELTDKCEEFAYRMAEEGVAIAQLKILDFDAVFTGELLNSMNLEQGDVVTNGATYLIYTNCGWALFNEFGTGLKGKENPHPDPSIAGWKYDVHDYGAEGWYYYKDGTWHWTQGIPSRPFMFETAQALRDSSLIANVAKDVFGS